MKVFSDQFPSKEKTFLDICKEFLEAIERDEKESMERAGVMIAERILQGEIVYVFGCGGHSWVPPWTCSAARAAWCRSARAWMSAHPR